MAELPRITIQLTEHGVVELLLNDTGRDVLVRELLALNRKHDHFHLDINDWAEVRLRHIPYSEKEKIFETAKVSYRPDDWDLQYFPHVIAPITE